MDKIKASQFADLAYYCKEPPLLPREYQQVEYLEATGSQYINTNIAPTSSDEVIIDFQFTNVSISDNPLTYSDWGSYSNGAFGLTTSNYGTLEYLCGWKTAGAVTTPAPNLNRHVIDIHNGVFTLDNAVIYSTNEPLPDVYPIFLFGWCRRGGNIASGQAKVYRLTIPNRIDLIPCYRKADSKPGMYDTVTNTFFTNSGTGEFTVGGNV